MDRLMEELVESLESAWAKERIRRTLSIFDETDREDSGDALVALPDSLTLSAPAGRGSHKRRDSEARALVLADVARDLALVRADIRTRSNRSFLLLVVFLCMAGISVLVAVGLAIAGAVAAASLTGVGVLLSGGAATGFWRLYLAETRRADAVMDDLQRVEDARVAYLLAMPGASDAPRGYIIEHFDNRPTSEEE